MSLPINPLGIDPERDQRINALAAQRHERAEAAVTFIRDTVLALLVIAGGVWALLTWLEPCAAGVLCSVVPLTRRPAPDTTVPRWWARLRLRLRLLRLRGRYTAITQDIGFLQRELAITRNLLDACMADADDAEEQIAWARSDLAKL